MSAGLSTEQDGCLVAIDSMLEWKCWLWPRGSVGRPRGSVGCGIVEVLAGLDCDVGFGDDGGGESGQCASSHS
ncbi:hypothetical protein Pmani_038699 [Petrolisthes manimaculis]|uniref:Uncharacterized protein n=1 Tax=Petrolisthes manimaculis TaxID=1843537 RepID=A0AAE1NEM9_9EUCA|nr:hypothetical protein Pmani_038699 [Petrolisthes manimaculis]